MTYNVFGGTLNPTLLLLLDLFILSGQTKTFHVLINTIPPCPHTGGGRGVEEKYYFHEGNWCSVFMAGCLPVGEIIHWTSSFLQPLSDS